jgi:peptidoglycan/xylan/chitin deacetylase (PgdA/CDA1 family)
VRRGEGGYTLRESQLATQMSRLFLSTLVLVVPVLAETEPLLEEPDEGGRVPILMYHHVSDSFESIYNVPPAVFENHLRQFYEAGFVLISLSDYCEDGFCIPAGRKPLILTFDDGHADNFRLLADGSVDPDCAVGIVEGFADEHPGFGRTAVFFLNAGSWVVPFGDGATAPEKLRWLVENGYEIGNHTTDHVNLRHCDPYQVQRQIGLCQAALCGLCPALEGRVRFFAYPYGQTPRDAESFRAVEEGSFDGVDYRMDLCLKAWGHTAPSPADPSFGRQRLAIPRIEMHTREGGNGHAPRWVIEQPDLYVSDGEPGSLWTEPPLTECTPPP